MNIEMSRICMGLNMIFNDYPLNYQFGFQDPATRNFEGVLDLNNRVMFY
jgi:hypothetical protein